MTVTLTRIHKNVCFFTLVGPKEHLVYGGGRYLMNIYFLKYCCLVKTVCCLDKKGKS